MNAPDEQGSVTLFVAITVTGLLVLVGLVVDGGGKVRAAQRASRVAAEAGRVAGQQIDVRAAIEGKPLRVDVPAAIEAARRYLRAAQVSGQVLVSSDRRRITVVVTTSERTVFLGLVGISELAAHGSAYVDLVSGVLSEE
ncbi:MAG: pilus assembly protein TadG-related protein [Candidatus Nanopelagicales bacterium]